MRLIDANALVPDTSFFDGGDWHYGYPAKWLKNQRWESTPPGRKKHFSYERDCISEEDFNALCMNLDEQIEEQTTVNMNEIRFD